MMQFVLIVPIVKDLDTAVQNGSRFPLDLPEFLLHIGEIAATVNVLNLVFHYFYDQRSCLLSPLNDSNDFTLVVFTLRIESADSCADITEEIFSGCAEKLLVRLPV